MIKKNLSKGNKCSFFVFFVQVKRQIAELKEFKDEVDPWMIKIESLNRKANELCEHATPQQARSIKEPLGDVNRRWDELNKSINNRQKELENALLRLGQFQHALNELLIWIQRTHKTLETLKPVYGDPQVRLFYIYLFSIISG